MSYGGRLIKLLFNLAILLFPLTGVTTVTITNKLIDTKKYNQTAFIGEKLYQYLQQQRWLEVEALLKQYQQQPDYELLLVNYAKAQLAQVKGDWQQAEVYYQQQLTQKIDFIPAQTGLILLYIQQGQYRKARKQLNQLNEISELPNHLNKSIQYYRTQLEPYFQGQRIYQMGFVYNDNVNNAPHFSKQVISQPLFIKVTKRGADPKPSLGVFHFFSFYQPYFIETKQSFSLYAYTRYIDYLSYRDANYLSFYTQLSYHYQQRKYQWLISPYYELKAQYTQSEYQLWGLSLQLFLSIYKKHSTNINVDYKIKKYREEFINLNSNELSFYFTYKYKFNNYLLWVNQLNHQKKHKKNHLLDCQEYDIKTGVNYQKVPQWDIAFFLSYKLKSFDNYNSFLNKKRKDNELNLSIIVKNPKSIVWGFYPIMELRYTRNLSNIDWLYSYQQREVLFKLEKKF